jgi:flavodoxin
MSKTLVAYFSCTGVTKKLAEEINGILKGDLYEIKPVEPYTDEDLDWTNNESRSSVEMNDKSFRPEFIKDLDGIEEYDTIYLGFPIWWYQAPTIINSFLENYDFTGKKIIPFATSGSSGMGETNKYLADSCKGAILVEGKRFGRPSWDELNNWINSL